MFGGNAGRFTEDFMVSKWKKEAATQFEKAGLTNRRNNGDEEMGSCSEELFGSQAVEPGEVKVNLLFLLLG